jgi:hypothetical protein
MPTFEVGLDDGRKLQIDADNQDAALAGAQHFLSNNLRTPTASKSTAGFDVQGARDAGYSDDEILDQLAKSTPNFDIQGAHKAGYTSGEILDFLHPATTNTPPLPSGFQLDNHPRAQGLPPLPDGYQIESQTAPAAAAPQDGPVTKMGLAKAAGAGLLSGTVGIPGDIVSLINLARRGYGAVTGGKYDPAKDDYSLGQTYNAVRNAADNVYQPQNNSESWFKWGGEMLPAVAIGPEGLAEAGLVDGAKILGKRAITQAAVPAAASAAAGAATQGTSAEPYARAGAALLAGGLGTKVPKVEPTTSAAISALADKHFSDFRAAPVTVRPDVVESAAKQIQGDLAASGLSKAPANDFVSQYIGNTNPVSLDQLQETRALLGKAAKQADTPEGVAAIRAKKAIDNLMEGLDASATVSGAQALPGAMDSLRQGRATSAVANQLSLIEKAQAAGEINADVSESSRNAVRQQFGSLLKNAAAMRKLGPYQPDISKIARGTVLANTLRKATKVTGSDWHSTPHWIGALLAADLGAGGAISTGIAAAPFAGIALKKWQSVLEKNRVDALKSRIGANAQGLPPQAPPFNPWPTRALIGTLAGNNTNGNQ